MNGAIIMDLNRFNSDDIHELRIKLAEEYSSMTPEEAEALFQSRVKRTKDSIEEMRRQRQISA